jgi:hypothetical protein
MSIGLLARAKAVARVGIVNKKCEVLSINADEYDQELGQLERGSPASQTLPWGFARLLIISHCVSQH